MISIQKTNVGKVKTILSALHETGRLTLQEAVSMIPDIALDAKPGENQSPYERNMPEQSDTPVPRAPDGATLPLNNRGAKVIEMSEQISDVTLRLSLSTL